MELSLVQLIRERMQDLGITRGELARHMGYANIAKGCRRLDQICARDVKMAENLRIQLAQGLEVDAGVIDESIEFTRSKQISAEDKAYRESFKPHAVILTEYKIPTQITFYAMTGGSRHRMIPMKEGSSPETFATQARDAPPDVVPFLGASTGYVVNYTPDFALEFNKEGRLIGRHHRAFRVGQSSVVVGGKEVGEGTMSALLGTASVSPSR